MATEKPPRTEAPVVPDQVKLKAVQAERLASISGVDAKSLTGLTVAQIQNS